MSFDEKIAGLVQRIPGLMDHLDTEEATKNALVMPFIAALGYDVFNPKEVIPEFVADVGIKKGEKVDYAIMREGKVLILIECKRSASALNLKHASQLYRYFSVTHARIAVLTNGTAYRFFTDLDEPNKMDQLPFLELDLENLRQGAVAEVKKLAKEEFDLDRMLSSASELKYTAEISRVLAAQIETPDEDLVRFFHSKVSGGRFTPSARKMFTPLVGKAFGNLVRDRVSSRLRNALDTETRVEPEPTAEEGTEESVPQEPGIETTEDELEAFRIVRAIACQAVPAERVFHRDKKSYMGILLDDNNRKTICRLHFNTSQKYIGVLDSEKNETRIPIDSLADIYLLKDQLLTTLMGYEQ